MPGKEIDGQGGSRKNVEMVAIFQNESEFDTFCLKRNITQRL
jgi:hypothetical protein